MLMNEKDLSVESFWIQVVKPFIVSSMYPSCIRSGSGISITFQGENFLESLQLLLGSHLIECSIRNSHLAVCERSPIFSIPQSILHAQLISPYYAENVSLVSVSSNFVNLTIVPTFIPSMGGCIIRVSTPDVQMVSWCIFSYDDVNLTLPFNKSYVSCISPQFSADVTHAILQVSNFDHTKISDQFILKMFVKPTIFSVQPSEIYAGFQSLFISGRFPASETLIASHHRLPVSVLSFSPSLIELQTSFFVGFHILRVSFNGGASWDLDIEIFVQSFDETYSVEPKYVISEGFHELIVSTSSLLQIGSFCKFNSVLSPLLIVNRTVGTCQSPLSSSSATMHVSIASPTLRTLASFVLPVIPKPIFSAVRPTSALTSQSSLVTIWGSNFLASFQYVCSFASIPMAATFLNCSTLVCSTPTASLSGLITLSFGYGNNSGKSSEIFQFVFLMDIVVERIHPSRATATVSTTVSLYGRNFPNDMFCKFGQSAYSFAFVLSSRQALCSTPLGLFGKMAFILTSLESATKSQVFPFEFLPSLFISRINPSIVQNSGSRVMVYGSGFSVNRRTFCSFDLIFQVDAVIMNSSHLACLTPILSLGHHNVSILDVDHIISEPKTLMVIEDSPVISIFPTLGATLGGTRLILSLSHSPSKLEVRFGNSTSLTATLAGGNRAEILSPKFLNGTFRIFISVDDAPFVETAHQFSFFSEPIIESIIPTLLSSLSTTVVTVYGKHLPISITVFCRFQGRNIQAALSTGFSEIVCVAPPMRPGNTTMELSFNGVDFFSILSSFRSSDVAVFTSLHPSAVSTSGGTSVTVSGSGFDSVTSCLFGDVSVNPFFVSGSIVVCVSPPMPSAGIHSFSITQRGHRSSNSTVIAINIATTHSVSPSVGIFGQPLLLHVTGAGFATQGFDYFCLVKNISVPADVLNSSCIACRVTVFERGLFEFSVRSVAPTQNRMMYLDFRRPIFFYVEPSIGPVNGGTIMNIFGTDFTNSPGLACKFGFLSRRGVWLSFQQVQCVTPAFTAGTTAIMVSFDGFEFLKTNLTHTFYATPSVSSIFPSFGDSKGQTPVIVTGANFFNSSRAFCSFGGTVVPLQYVFSSTRLTCKSPPRVTAGAVVVEVSFNGVDLSSSGVAFLYTDSVTLNSISSSEAPSSGRTLLTIHGTDFYVSSESHCKFGDETVPALYQSPSAVVCETPPHVQGRSLLQFSSNSVDYVWDQFDFNFFDALGITSISTSTSSIRGGVPIFIFGGGFDEDRSLSCRFGDTEASTRILNASCLECITPQMQPGRSNLSVISLSSSVLVGVYSFDFHQDAVLLSISPTAVTAGSLNTITIFGKGFLRMRSFVCVFGLFHIHGNVSSSESATCQFPALSSGSVTLSISNDGIVFSDSTLAIFIKDCSQDPNCLTDQSKVLSSCVPESFCQQNLIISTDIRGGSAGLLLDVPIWNGHSWTLTVGALFSKPPRTLSTLEVSASSLTTVAAFDTSANSVWSASLRCFVGNDEVSVNNPIITVCCQVSDYQHRVQTVPTFVNISINDTSNQSQSILCATDPHIGFTLNCVMHLRASWFDSSSLLSMSASALDVTVRVASIFVYASPRLTIPDPFGLIIGPLPLFPVASGIAFNVPISAIVPEFSAKWPISGVGRGIIELNWNSSCLTFVQALASSMFAFSAYNTSDSVSITFMPTNYDINQQAAVVLGEVQLIASSACNTAFLWGTARELEDSTKLSLISPIHPVPVYTIDKEKIRLAETSLDGGMISIESNMPSFVLGYASVSDLFNTEVLGIKSSLSSTDVYTMFGTRFGLKNATKSDLFLCESLHPSIMSVRRVENYCQAYFEGSEESGGLAIIRISIHDIHTLVTIRVHFPSIISPQYVYPDSSIPIRPILGMSDCYSNVMFFRSVRVKTIVTWRMESDEFDSLLQIPLQDLSYPVQLVEVSSAGDIHVSLELEPEKFYTTSIGAVILSKFVESRQLSVVIDTRRPWAVPLHLSVLVPTDSHVSNNYLSGLNLLQSFSLNVTYSSSSPIFVGSSRFPIQVVLHFDRGSPMAIADPNVLIVNTSDSSSFVYAQNASYYLGVSQYSLTSNSTKVNAFLMNCGNIVAKGTSNSLFYANATVDQVLVKSSAVFLAAKGNAQAKALGIEATARISLFLLYNDQSVEPISIKSVTTTTPGNFVRLVSVAVSNEFRVEPLVSNGVEATVCFNYSKTSSLLYYTCSTFVIIKPAVIPVVSFLPFPASSWTSSNFSMSVLKRIDKANNYQRARLSVTLLLSNGTDVDISNSNDIVITSTQSPSSPSMHQLVRRNVSSESVLVLEVTPAPTGPITSPVTVTVKAVFAKLFASTGQQRIIISPTSADVISINASIPFHIDGFALEKFYLQVIPVLAENCNGVPCNFTADPFIQPNWISMSSSQPWAIDVNNSDLSLIIVGNTVGKAVITVSVVDIWVKPFVVRLSAQYWVSSNLMTSSGCSDLGSIKGPPLTIFDQMNLQIWYNAPDKIGSVTLGVHIGGEFNILNVTSMVPNSAFDYSLSYTPRTTTSLPTHIVVLVFVFSEFTGPKGLVNLADVHLVFNPNITVAFYNTTLNSSFFGNNSNFSNFQNTTVTVKNETRTPDEYYFVSEIVEFVAWSSPPVRALKNTSTVSAEEGRTRFQSSISSRIVCPASNISSSTALFRQTLRWIRNNLSTISCKTLNVTGNINADCEISGADALALVKYFTPSQWPLCGILLSGTIWSGCGLNMICSGNASSDKCLPPSGSSILDVDMNGIVSLSDLNILMSFITKRTSLLTNVTILTPGNNELSVLVQFINSDMTRPSANTTLLFVELGLVSYERWTCSSSMPSISSLNGFVFDGLFQGDGAWIVRVSNFSRTLTNLGVVVVIQTNSSGRVFKNVFFESPFFGAIRFTPLKVINASKTSALTSKVYGWGLTIATAGLNSRFFIASYDNFGLPRTVGGDKFSVTITGSFEHSTSWYIQDYRNGSYMIGYSATVSGLYLVNVFLDEINLIASAKLMVMPSFPSALFSQIDRSRSDMNMTVPAGRCSQALFLMKDQFNNSLNYIPSASLFMYKLTPEKSADLIYTSSEKDCFGLFGVSTNYLTFKYLFTRAGTYTFSIIGPSCSMSCLSTCECVPFSDGPFIITVLPTEPFAFTSYAVGEALHTSRAGQLSEFTMKSMDQYNNSISFFYFNEFIDSLSNKKIFILNNVSSDHKYLHIVLRGPIIHVATINNPLDGTLTVTYKVEKVGSYFVEMYYYGGIALNSGTFLTIFPPGIHAPNTYAVYSRNPVAGDPFSITIVTKDIFENLMSIFGYKFNATCFSEGLVQNTQLTIQETHFYDLNNGNYTLTLYPTIAASYLLSINVLDQNPSVISGSPFRFRVQPRNTTAASTTIAHGLGLERIATAGVFNEFFIQAKDVFGNLRSSGGDKFSAEIVPLNQEFNATISTRFEDTNSGVYRCAYKVTKSGKYMAFITLFGANILGTPYPITIYSAELDTGGSGLSNFNLLLTAGIEMTFNVNARDRFGNLRDEGGPLFEVRAIGNQTWAPSNVTGTIVYESGGMYSGSLTVYVSGNHRLYITSSGTPIDNGLARNLIVLPAQVSLESIVSSQILATAGLSHTFYIQARDEFSNHRTEGGGQFSSQIVYLDGPMDTIFAVIVDLSRGIFSASFFPTVSGKYAVFVQLDGDDIKLCFGF
jgi:hypothetical protein